MFIVRRGTILFGKRKSQRHFSKWFVQSFQMLSNSWAAQLHSGVTSLMGCPATLPRCSLKNSSAFTCSLVKTHLLWNSVVCLFCVILLGGFWGFTGKYRLKIFSWHIKYCCNVPKDSPTSVLVWWTLNRRDGRLPSPGLYRQTLCIALTSLLSASAANTMW